LLDIWIFLPDIWIHQVLVLTHANASVEEAIPYMQTHASKVLTVAGRSAAVKPTCKPATAVHFGWKDCLLPIMLSGQVPEDTLFLVCEEDFRFEEEQPNVIPHADGSRLTRRFPKTQGISLVEEYGLRGCAAFQEGEERSATPAQAFGPNQHGDERSASRSQAFGPKQHGDERSASRAQAFGPKQHGDERSASRAAPGAASSGRKRQKAERSAATFRGHGPTSGASSGSTASPESSDQWWSQSLEDLVAYCNIAAKGKAGDVVWLSWCPFSRADDDRQKADHELVPHHGTTCLGISIRGARAMAHALKQHEPWHFDCWLQRQLSGGEGSLKKHDGFGASYLWPPTGSYATHKSGCQVGKARSNIAQGLTAEGVRLADWGYPNQPFTRVPNDLIDQVRNPRRPEEKWLRYCLVNLAPRKRGERPHGLKRDRPYLHGSTYAEALKSCDLNADMRKGLWWTYAARAMMKLKDWYKFNADHPTLEAAVEHLYSSVHYAAPRGSLSAERSAAAGAESSDRERSYRQVRKSNVQLSFRLDWNICEAWV
jgi:hypothetical protein